MGPFVCAHCSLRLHPAREADPDLVFCPRCRRCLAAASSWPGTPRGLGNRPSRGLSPDAGQRTDPWDQRLGEIKAEILAGILHLPAELPHEADHLGKPEAVFESSRRMAFSIVLFGLVCLGLAGGLGYLHHDGQINIHPFMKLFLALLLFGLGACGLGAWALCLASLTVVVCAGGLLILRAGKTEVFLWDQIEAVFMEAVFQSTPAAEGGSIYRVRTWDGATFAFRRVQLPHIDGLAGRIVEEVRRRYLPPALAAFEAGEAVAFGDLQVSREGLGWRGRAVPWALITEIKVNAFGSLEVRRKGGIFSWCKVPLRRIPNFCVATVLLGQRPQVGVRRPAAGTAR